MKRLLMVAILFAGCSAKSGESEETKQLKEIVKQNELERLERGLEPASKRKRLARSTSLTGSSS